MPDPTEGQVQGMINPNPAQVQPAQAQGQNGTEALQANLKTNNATPIGSLEKGLTEFLLGEPVHIKIAAGSGLSFTAKNEQGVEYDFVATGQFELTGKPQKAAE